MMTRAEMTEVDRKLAAAYERIFKAVNILKSYCTPYTYKAYRNGKRVTVEEWRKVDVSADWPRIDAAVAARKQAIAERDALDEIWRTNGMWSRYYLVTSSDGHVHREMNCTTCFPTTMYNWLIDLAGADEAEMVATYGSDACTVCFPSAPALPGWGVRKSERDKQIARDERAAKAAAKKAEAEARRLVTKIREMKADLRDAFVTAEFEPNTTAAFSDHLIESRKQIIATLPAKIADLSGEAIEEIIADARTKAKKEAIKGLKGTLCGWFLNQPSVDPAWREKAYAAARADLKLLGVKGF